MGVLHHHVDATTYLSRMLQGESGEWLVQFMHTPDQHVAVMVQPFYILLGHLTRISLLPAELIFQVGRILASIFMLSALYQLAAVTWTRVKARRTFFVLATVGSGLGWIVFLFTGEMTTVDLNSPLAFPIYGALVSIHYPLATACLALTAAEFIPVFRPGADQQLDAHTGAPVIFLGLSLAILYGLALLPITLALIASVVAKAVAYRRLPRRELSWLSWFVIPTLPLTAYYVLTALQNPAFEIWLRQRQLSAPGVLSLILGLGVLLILSFPGLVRAVRRLEADGDRFMLFWLAAILIFIFLPVFGGMSFGLGLVLPVAYFATRSLDDYWFKRVFKPPRMQLWLYVIAIPVLSLSQLLVIFLPIFPLYKAEAEGDALLREDYRHALAWIGQSATSTDVIMTAPTIGVWVPIVAKARPVYGHPSETFNAETRLRLVIDWYASSNVEDCSWIIDETATRTNGFAVHYVIYGPYEQPLGPGVCLDLLRPVATLGEVSIYVTPFVLPQPGSGFS